MFEEKIEHIFLENLVALKRAVVVVCEVLNSVGS